MGSSFWFDDEDDYDELPDNTLKEVEALLKEYGFKKVKENHYRRAVKPEEGGARKRGITEEIFIDKPLPLCFTIVRRYRGTSIDRPIVVCADNPLDFIREIEHYI